MKSISGFMTLDRFLAKFGLIAAVVFVFSVIDTAVSGYRESKTLFRALPGVSESISGTLEAPVASLAEMGFACQSDAVRVAFTGVQGRLWFGQLKVASHGRPGLYDLRVFSETATGRKEAVLYTVWLFENHKALTATYKSFVRRVFGFSPIWMVIMVLPLVAASLGGSYYLSSRQEDYLAENGIVPIVRMVRCEQGWEIEFPLGARHGLSPSDELLLLDENFDRVGRVAVTQIKETHGRALVASSVKIAPSYWLLQI